MPVANLAAGDIKIEDCGWLLETLAALPLGDSRTFLSVGMNSVVNAVCYSSLTALAYPSVRLQFPQVGDLGRSNPFCLPSRCLSVSLSVGLHSPLHPLAQPTLIR